MCDFGKVSAMQAFTRHRGIVMPLNRANVDTDAIIPKQFLKSISRIGYGEQLFFDWRYLPDGSDNPDFIMNKEPWNKATILLAQNNFGCGSSREHAVWAVAQFGFRAVIAPSKQEGGEVIPAFADIFRNNCGKNGVLTVELKETEVAELFQLAEERLGFEITVDLERQVVVAHAEGEREYAFSFDPGLRKKFLQGMDDIGMTLAMEADIAAFEATHNTQIGAE